MFTWLIRMNRVKGYRKLGEIILFFLPMSEGRVEIRGEDAQPPNHARVPDAAGTGSEGPAQEVSVVQQFYFKIIPSFLS